MKDGPLKFRWVCLIAVGLWLFTVVCYEAGLTEPGVFTFGRTFVVPALLLTAIWPVTVARLVRWRWFHPAVGTWLAFSLPAFNLGIIWLFGMGSRCLGVSIVGGIGGFVVINLIWLRELRKERESTRGTQSDPPTATVSSDRISETAVARSQ